MAEDGITEKVQRRGSSQLAVVMGDKAKPRGRVQHVDWVSEIIATRALYTSSASHTHMCRYHHKGTDTCPVKWVLAQREGSNYGSHKYTNKVLLKGP